MGFSSVYQTLKELFPQVDTRLLKAVAIEHAEDPDGAVESILIEVLPFTSEKSDVGTTIVRNIGKIAETPSLSSSIPGLVQEKEANDTHLLNDTHNNDGDSLASSFYDANDTDDLQNGNIRIEESVSFTRCEEKIVETSQAEQLVLTSGSLIDDSSTDDCVQAFGDHEGETFVPSLDCQEKRTDVHVDKTDDTSSSTINTEDREADASLSNQWNVNRDCAKDAPGFEYCQEQQFQNCNLLGSRIYADRASTSVTELEDESGMPFFDAGNKEMGSYVDADFTHELPLTDLGGAVGETASSTIVTQSGQICRINLLEDIIEEAKIYKDSLFTATEAVLKLIEDVEHQEKEAEQAKAAAERGGFDILEKVEERKKMLKHAKEANEMHAGEVYGEKSILATEVRELQTRLLGLADEKDKSLALLDEMRKALEARLAASEEERKAAENEMLEKQEIARGALVEQEFIMEKVVQESKLLQQEAKENAKLRDFLMEKGHFVDELQGEISVICQDVKSLKEKFDKRVCLSKSLFIEQTSFRMASSTSSVRSMTSSVRSVASDSATGHVETPRRISAAPSAECQTPKSNVGEEADGSVVTTHHNDLLDDDWELFDF